MKPACPMFALLLLLACSCHEEPAAGPTPGGGGADDTGVSSADDGLADLVLRGGDVVTMDPDQPRVTALAIRGGELVYVGGEDGIGAWIGDETEVVGLEGRMVIPGLHDAHIHLLEAHHEAGGTCLLTPGRPLTEYASVFETCRDQQQGTDWLLGWGFAIDRALESSTSPRDLLDAWVPDAPAAIMESTSHSVWVNSRALELLGLNRSSPDPTGGLLLKDRDGELNGILVDAAGELAFDMALERSDALDAMNEAALRRGIAHANAWGITSVGDARAYWKRGYVEAWRAVDAAGDLNLRAVVGLWAYPDMDDDEQIATLSGMFDDTAGARLRFSQVKVYSDGLLQNTTAALQQPYDCPTLGPSDGLNYFDAERLARYVRELEAVGFDMHIHTIGDRGVHESLDAIQAARTQNGDLGRRHRLTHVEWLDPADVERFKALDVSADFQMSYEWVEPAWESESYYYAGRDRTKERAWRLRDLYEAGANVVLSSDYDVGSLSPFDGMARAIDRGDQSLPDVDAALRAYTINAAYTLGHEDLTGSLTVGKRADLVVVDRDLYATPALANTQVLWVLLDGEQVHRSDDF